jgi:hypothetical protein
MRFVLHPGVHKTGTSTLQHFLADNATALLERGIYYPVGFFPQFTRQHSALAFGLRREDTQLVHSFFEHCRDRFTSDGAHTTIVSGEELSLLSEPALRMLRAAILDTDPSAQINVILYYRNLYDVSISIMQQIAKGNRRLLDGLFDGPRDKRVISRLNPTRQISSFEQVFGPTHVTVGNFDDAVHGEGIERHFLDLARIEWTDDLVSADSRNVSMDLISSTFLNMLGYEFDLNRSMWRHYARVVPTSYVLPRLRNDMIEGLRETIAAIDVSHPKLRDARENLTHAKVAPLESRPELADFLESFEALIHELRASLDERPRQRKTRRG